MRRSHEIARGGATLLAAQVVIFGCQIGYSAVTSRAFDAKVFGNYTVALTASGLLSLLLTTGLPSFALATRAFDGSRARVLILLSLLGGVAASLAMVFGRSLWANAWDAPGSASFTQALALQVAIAGPGAVQLALLRREGRPGADAAIQAVAAAVGAGVGTAVVVSTHRPLALIANPAATALTILVLAIGRRSVRYGRGRLGGWAEVGKFSRTVTVQNLGFWLLSSLPIWVVSRWVSIDELGQYSRASLLAGLPATAFATALTRALQPFYRHLDDANRLKAGIDDAVLVTTALCLPLFGLLAVTTQPLIDLWLGPGWNTAAGYARPLVLGFAVYAIFTVLANAAEMTNQLAAVRYAQVVMIVPALTLAALTVWRSSAWPASFSMLGISLSGLMALLHRLERQGAITELLTGRLAAQALWATLPIVLALATVVGTGAVMPDTGIADVVTVAMATAVWAAGCLTTLKRQPVWTVMASRDLVPRRLRGAS